MKHLLMLTLAAFFLAAQANAQHINIGIKGGVNAYNIQNDNSATNDPLVGFHLGLLSHIHLARQVAFQPEIVLSTQGAKYKAPDAGTKLNLAYINVPLLIQYMFDNGFRLQAGPQVGFLASAKSTFNGRSTDVKSTLEPIEVGLSAGVGYVNPPTGLGIDLRYNHGLSNINKNDIVKSTNRGIQIGLFYLFGHK